MREFQIPGTSMDYIDLKKSKLCLQINITKEDGSKIIYEVDEGDRPTANCDQVAPINFAINSLFRQVDTSLNQQIISPSVGVNHAYKSILDLLLSSSNDTLNSEAQGGLFYMDTAGAMENFAYDGTNYGFFQRSAPIREGQTVTTEGRIYSDFIEDQERLILNGVAINIKLFHATDSFRLGASKNKKYKLVITNAILKVCQVTVNPSMILAHDQALSKSSAIYPFGVVISRVLLLPWVHVR